MKMIKTISLVLGMLAVSTWVNAQQQTTQKAQTATPATGTNELKKTNTQKKAGNKGTLTAAERNAAARRHKETKSNGASPSLTDSRTDKPKTKEVSKVDTKRADSAGQRRATGMRDSKAAEKDSSATPTKRADAESR